MMNYLKKSFKPPYFGIFLGIWAIFSQLKYAQSTIIDSSFSCKNPQMLLSDQADCNLNFYSTEDSVSIQIDHGDGIKDSLINLNTSQEYYGGNMPFNLTSTSTITLTNANDPLTSLLVQAEILNRGAFFGFEVYASAEGVIRVSLLQPVSSKGVYSNWTSYFGSGSTGMSSNTLLELYPELDVGYNLFVLKTPQDVSSNTLVSWSPEPGTGRIALDTSSTAIKDYYYNSGTISQFTPAGRFYFKSLMKSIDTVLPIVFSYSYPGCFSLQANIWNSANNYVYAASQNINVHYTPSLNFTCLNYSVTMSQHSNQPFSCNISYFSTLYDSYQTFLVDYRDATSTSVSFYSSYGSFGNNVLFNISQDSVFDLVNANEPLTVLLSNAEILSDYVSIYGFEIYGIQEGVIRLTILNPTSSKGTLATWSDYLLTSSTLSTLNVTDLYLYIQVGYNLIALDTQIDVKRNTLFSWCPEPGSGRIALDKNSTINYPDYYYDGQKVTSLNTTAKWRYYFKVLTQVINQTTASPLIKSFNTDYPGTYFVNITYQNPIKYYDVQPQNIPLFVRLNDLATFYCPLATNVYYNEQSIKCNFSLSNTFYDNATVELKYGYGNSDIYQFTKNYKYYGEEVPLTLTTASELISPSDPLTVALVNSEILNQSSIVGYELYASSSGVIRISHPNPTSNPGSFITYNDYFLYYSTGNHNFDYQPSQYYNEIYPYVSVGYNLIIFKNPIDRAKNTIIQWSPEPGSGRISTNTTNYPDYYLAVTVSGSQFLGTISSLSTTAKLRFNFRVITTSINAIVNIDKNFAYPGYYKMSAKYLNTPNELATRIVDIFLRSNETLTMPTLQYFNSFLNVSYSIITPTLYSSMSQIIDYGDSSIYAFNMTPTIIGFGSTIPYTLVSATDLSSYQNPSNFLMPNVEPNLNCKLYGFEIFASQAGVIRITLIFPNSSRGSHTSWSSYFSAGNIAITSVDSVEIYSYLNLGNNFVLFNVPFDIQKNTLVTWSADAGSGRIALDSTGTVTYPDYNYNGATVSSLGATVISKFYFRLITKTLQANIVAPSKTYAYPGLYRITVGNSSSLLSIKSNNDANVNCPINTVNISQNFVCNVSYYSTTNEYNLVQLNYNDGNIGTYNFTKKYFNFGPDIPFNITSPFELTDTSNDPTAYTAIMTNTELLNRSSVLGFEMFATSAGLIRINILIPTSSKSTYNSWQNYFAAGQTAFTAISYTEIYVNIRAGYNLIMFNTPIDVNQDALVSWSTEPGSGRIALDLNGANYNDYFYSGTLVSSLSSTGKFTPPPTTKTRFFFKLITKSINENIQVRKNYIYPGTYNVSYNYFNTQVNSQSLAFSTMNILLLQPFMKINCTKAYGMTGDPIGCSLIYETFNMTLDVMIDYGDGETGYFSGINSTVPNPLVKSYARAGFYNIFLQSAYKTFLNYTIEIKGDSKCLNPSLKTPMLGSLSVPYKVNRSDILSVVVTIFYPCDANITSESKLWNVYKLNSADNTPDISLDLASSNPTRTISEIVFDSNTLTYGTYMFTFTSTYNYINIRTNQLELRTGVLTTYIEVIPSGIAVFGWANGISYSLFGAIQSITIDPGSNSIDFDSLANIPSLTFNFYCRRVDKTDTSVFDPTLYSDITQVGSVTNFKQINDNNMTCIWDPTFLTATINKITIRKLYYVPNATYQFLIKLDYLGRSYKQLINTEISYMQEIPSVSLRCRFSQMCKPYPTYALINTNSPLMIDGFCSYGCKYSKKVSYSYNVIRNTGDSVNKIWTNLGNVTEVIGFQTPNLFILSNIFKNYPSSEWKVELNINADNVTGMSSLNFKTNSLPMGGTCTIDLEKGIALSTYFVITCMGWYDLDGVISRYEYYVNYVGNPTPIALNFNSNGVLKTQLSLGPAEDGYRMYIFVKIYDDFNGVTDFHISKPINVTSDAQVTTNIMNQLISQDPSSSVLLTLKNGNLNDCAKSVISLASTLNSMSYTEADPTDASQKNATSDSILAKKEEERNSRANGRSALINVISSLPMSSPSSLKLFASMISVVTRNTEEITKDTALNSVQLSSNIITNLKKFENRSTIDDVLQLAGGIFESVQNSYQSMSGPLLGKAQFLGTDTESAQKKALQKANEDMTPQIEYLSSSISTRLFLEQNKEIITPSVSLSFTKKTLDKLPKEATVNSGSFQLSSIEDLLANSNQNISMSEKALIQKVVSYPNSNAGCNAEGEVSIGDSATIGLEFYDDIKNTKLEVKNQKKPIDFYIKRDEDLSKNLPPFTKINATSFNITTSSNFLNYKVNVTNSNVSLHIQIRPETQTSVAYLALLKFGDTPNFDNSTKNYDIWKLFCPSDLRYELNDSFYMLFSNVNQTNGFRGMVGLGFHELNEEEMNLYCNKSSSNSTNIMSDPPSLSHNLTFKYDFGLRVYSSGCYFMSSSGSWSTEGVEVMEDTNITHTHCQSTHLTEFAGGFVVLPAKIDFGYVFANADITKNPTIYATIITLACLYILLAIFSRICDVKDDKKLGITNLANPKHNFLYEVTIFTGSRFDAETNSNVHMVLSGDECDSKIYHLNDDKRKVFKRGAVDTFVVSNASDIGNLSAIRIWHDNTGQGNKAGWYLKYIIVNDLSINEKYYFICEKWLAIDKDDFQVERMLPVCGEKQKTEFKYLLQKQTKQNMMDGHLWFSIFARPVQSTFTRLDRLTCAFVLLYMSMMMNILYYGIAQESTKKDGLKIGPLNITPEQLSIGVITNLIIFPPSFILVQLFRRSKRKSSTNKTDIQREKLDIEKQLASSSNSDGGNGKKKKKPPLKLPWWCKIIAYILSFSICGTCSFFIIVQGVQFGDEKVGKWLTSLVMSFVTGVFMTQPAQVALTTFFFVAIFRSSKEDEQNEVNGSVSNKKKNTAKRRNSANEEVMQENSSPLVDAELDELREKRMKELKIENIIKKCIWHSAFLWLIYVVSYSNRDINAYSYQSAIKTTFLQTKVNEESVLFSDITFTNDIISWLRTQAAPSLRYYSSSNGIHRLRDNYSVILANPILRQIRVQNNTCKLSRQFKNLIGYCTEDLGILNVEKNAYDVNWQPINSANSSELFPTIYKSFRYTDSSVYNNYPYLGIYTTYTGGGYVYELKGNETDLKNDFSLLQQQGWIDRQTRALFLEFPVYNPNVNLFSYCMVLFEFLPSGNMIKSMRFSPLNLLSFSQGVYTFNMICSIVYMIIVFLMMCNEIRKIIKLRKEYLTEFWSYVDWLVIAFSWSAFTIFLYRLYSSYTITDSFNTLLKTGKSKKYINLQNVQNWNEILDILFGFLSALATIKFFQILSFSDTISLLSKTLKRGTSELLNFAFIFLIIWMAFVQLMFLIFYQKLPGFASMISSMETAFGILLGKFDALSLVNSVPYYGVIIFTSYNVLFVFILLGMFVTILMDSFEATRKEPKNTISEHDVFKYIASKFISLIPFTKTAKNGELAMFPDRAMKYLDTVDSLTLRTDQLLKKVEIIADDNDKNLKF